jgi:hypothetical protein
VVSLNQMNRRVSDTIWLRFRAKVPLSRLRSGQHVLLAFLLAFLPFVVLVLAVSGAAADPVPESATVSNSNAPADSGTSSDWGSIYAGIQAGFVKLEPIFRKGCFDCHSNQTHYPWYHAIPGIKQLIDKDIRVAHKRLDMSKGFPFSIKAPPADDLARIRGELADHDMPPWDYRLMHWSANPSEAERDSVIRWIDQSLRKLAAHGQYPFGQPSEAPESDEGEEGADSSE